MATPKVTINVKQKLTSEQIEQMAQGLYFVYVQATKGEQRAQWCIFPPAKTELGVNEPYDGMVIMERLQISKGNKAKWFHSRRPIGEIKQVILDLIENKVVEGFTPGYVTVVSLDHGEYQKVWNDQETPHKALRHLDYQLRSKRITVK